MKRELGRTRRPYLSQARRIAGQALRSRRRQAIRAALLSHARILAGPRNRGNTIRAATRIQPPRSRYARSYGRSRKTYKKFYRK